MVPRVGVTQVHLAFFHFVHRVLSDIVKSETAIVAGRGSNGKGKNQFASHIIESDSILVSESFRITPCVYRIFDHVTVGNVDVAVIGCIKYTDGETQDTSPFVCFLANGKHQGVSGRIGEEVVSSVLQRVIPEKPQRCSCLQDCDKQHLKIHIQEHLLRRVDRLEITAPAGDVVQFSFNKNVQWVFGIYNIKGIHTLVCHSVSQTRIEPNGGEDFAVLSKLQAIKFKHLPLLTRRLTCSQIHCYHVVLGCGLSADYVWFDHCLKSSHSHWFGKHNDPAFLDRCRQL
mmetsp:Transcript_4303/g.9555  ORF Transcript_4303/g.9555 Transcript_4303/m.9555 type:complete len:286 (+) Transcript_4303:252-1109(+)